MNKIRITLKLYRRDRDDPKHVLSERAEVRGGVYHEFEETWERPRSDAPGQRKHQHRVAQRPTGRSFRFVDRVTGEYLEGRPDERARSRGLLVLTIPEDFTFLRLARV